MDSRKRSYKMLMQSRPPLQAARNDDNSIHSNLCSTTTHTPSPTADNYDKRTMDDILDEKTGKLKTCYMILDTATGLFITSEIEAESESEEPFKASDSDATYCDSDQENNSSSGEDDLFIAKKSTRSGKGMANPETWKKNQPKIAREKGKKYITDSTYKGVKIGLKKRQKRVLKSKCLSARCKTSKTLKCWDIDDDKRKQMFENFWNMTWDQRKLFIVALVDKVPVKQRTTSKKVSRRNFSLKYYLRVSGVKLSVCKNTFLNTFCLREATIHSWINKASDCSSGSKTSKRGLKAKEISEAKLKHVNTFLDRMPTMESHYCRKNSAKKYFEVNYQSMQQVYREYEKYFRDFNLPGNDKIKYNRFRLQVLKRNYSLFKPRKDQCDTCFSYKSGNISNEEYESHIKNKDKARKEKELDKLAAQSGLCNLYTVDVQAVQLVPYSQAGALYFKLKLACHQFTIYDLATNKAFCYVWHEGCGEMTANIFASCLLDFIDACVADKSLPIIIYSDGCAAQNRNVVLANALKYYSEKNGLTITQKYLCKGHTQMECDTVHSHIESQKKNRELHVPADFVKIIKEASLTQKYDVKYADWTFFKKYDTIDYLKSIRPGNKPGDPCVNDLKALCYKPNSPIEYKLDFDEQWLTMPQRAKKLRTDLMIPPLYSGPLPISKRKFDDLQDLKSVIVRDHHSFYDNLPHKN